MACLPPVLQGTLPLHGTMLNNSLNVLSAFRAYPARSCASKDDNQSVIYMPLALHGHLGCTPPWGETLCWCAGKPCPGCGPAAAVSFMQPRRAALVSTVSVVMCQCKEFVGSVCCWKSDVR